LAKILIYVGAALIAVGVLFSVVNYIFHMPEYRPEWFDRETMVRLIELNLVFTITGLITTLYAALKT